MSIKISCLALCALLLTLSFRVEVQKASNVPRIGVLCEGSVSTFGNLVEALRGSYHYQCSFGQSEQWGSKHRERMRQEKEICHGGNPKDKQTA